jgi:hypothetical protein
MKNCAAIEQRVLLIIFVSVIMMLAEIPALAVEGPDIGVDADSIDYGDVVVGTTVPHTITVSNTGDETLNVTATTLVGDDSNHFVIISGGGPFEVTPLDLFHYMEVGFRPRSNGKKSTFLRIESNDPDENPVNIKLKGNGVSPDIDVKPTHFDFGDETVGQSVSYLFVVKNTGTADLNITSIYLDGTHFNQFRIKSGSGAVTIPPDRPDISHNIIVSFKPTTTGTKWAELGIESNDPDENPYKIDLQGNGVRIDLKVVQPYLHTSPFARGMHLEWSAIAGASEYQWRRKSSTVPTWGEWQGPVTNTSVNDFGGISEGTKYTYQVRFKIDDGWSEASSERSNRVARIWPVTKTKSPTAASSWELLHGYNQAIESNKKFYLHEGIDVQGEEGFNGECVRAPMGGVIHEILGYGDNYLVVIKLRLEGNDRWLRINHLDSLSAALVVNESIEVGTKLGIITETKWSPDNENNHIHIDLVGDITDLDAQRRNPLEAWSDDDDRDPRNIRPKVGDTNSDNLVLRFRKGPNETGYLPDDGRVFGAVDIVVEAYDQQSSDEPWEVPKKVGYYIQKCVGVKLINAVQTPQTPYLLIDGSNWFGAPALETPASRMNALFDSTESLKGVPPVTPNWYYWKQWFTYIVTNTKGTTGIVDDVDANQCWVTNALKTETSPNGYRDGQEGAKVNLEAKFQDGRYRVRIRLEDFVGMRPDFGTDPPIIVDNFRPYIKKVKVKKANKFSGQTIYSAQWLWTPDSLAGDSLKLSPRHPDAGIIGTATGHEDLTIEITASEPMREVSIPQIDPMGLSLDVPDSVSSDSTKWFFIIPEEQIPDDGSADGKHILWIQGYDDAYNFIEGYTEDKTSYGADEIPQRQDDGSWSPPGLTGYDKVHRFTIGMPVGVELASFQATAGQGFIALDWMTASETNCHLWELYRGKQEDGEYANIGELPGHGSTETAHDYRWVDRQVRPETIYFYKLKQIDFDGSEWWSDVVSASAVAAVPETYALCQNYPNPFNANTEIGYQIPKEGHVTVKIFNTLGQEVRILVDEDQGAGWYGVIWDGEDNVGGQVASGLYFCKLKAGDFNRTVKMVLLR